ncbi:hypothetical protein [Flagellimonas iocasae]|uniref:SEC-C motif-containing protein n=1 Tax=Flagellimonas iocasae TaxID=2055905 RepID=A0ABW4XY15_9FLAO
MVPQNEIEEALLVYEDLSYASTSNMIYGTLHLPDKDSYEIEIDLKPCPKFFPSVKETGGRIPIKLDRHIYPITGSCCFTTRAQSQILLKTKVKSLLMFLDLVVVPYFENNSFYEIHNCYFGDEYPHDESGILHGYRDILKIEDRAIIERTIANTIANSRFREHQLCYCGSGRKLRKCTHKRHIQNLRNLYLVDKDVLKSDLKLLS